MKYAIQFQYKPADVARPHDEGQDEEIVLEAGDAWLIPAVGDSVTYLYGGSLLPFKVLTRHFSYLHDWCAVNIVVTDLPSDEMSARLKE